LPPFVRGEADEVSRGVDREIKNKKLKNNIYYIDINRHIYRIINTIDIDTIY